MTRAIECPNEAGAEARPSLLPFDPGDLLEMRVLPAQFARMVGVSKQAVSQWIKRGIIQLGADGRLEPKRAARQVIERTDPTRLRARVFKHATSTHAELRTRIRDLEAELAQEREMNDARTAAAKYSAEAEAVRKLQCFTDALMAQFEAAVGAHAKGHLDEWLDELVAVAFFGLDLDEYRNEMAGELEHVPNLSRVDAQPGTNPGR